MTVVDDNLAAIRQRIAVAGGDPETVTIVAMTKGFGAAAVAAARSAGLDDLGENYVDELRDKHDGRGRWHFAGAVQRRKVRELAPLVDVWQGLDRLEEGVAIATQSPGATVLVQVDVTGLTGRSGCSPEETATLVGGLRDLELDVAGLMAIGPVGDVRASRQAFGIVRRLADELGVRQRSMGMSDDLESAIAEGSTMVRIGRALFGPRSGPVKLRR